LKAFSFFDEEENGYITESDLKKIMSAFGELMNEEETKEILKYAKSQNGRIYYRDFAKTIINGRVE
jgi:Ca2+-binding EF-hand superfamily protein